MPFSEKLKLKIKRRAHFACCLCHALGVDVHHIISQEEGGPNTEDNAAPLCPSCHETYGANRQKRRFIREARDFWYEICDKRFASDPDRLDEISNVLKGAVTKADFDTAIDKIVALLRDLGKQHDRSAPEKSREIAQIGGMVAAGVSVNKHCQNCGTYIGLLIGDSGRCPNCGSPW